jgi:hypothetical protein
VAFSAGIEYAFAPSTQLQPGARTVIAANRSAFLLRYPGASSALAAGAFLNGSNLDNAGDTITLNTGTGAILRTFAYDDKAPWPTEPDGSGASLVLIAPTRNPDHSLAQNWRTSVDSGNPGASDAAVFTGNPHADADGDGISALAEYAFGTSDTVRNDPTDYLVPNGTDPPLPGSPLPNADSVTVELQASDNLVDWVAEAPNPNRAFWRWKVTLRP